MVVVGSLSSTCQSLDDVSRTLEQYQKWMEQHPELFRSNTIWINMSCELLSISDFYIYLIPFCHCMKIQLSVTRGSTISTSSQTIEYNIEMLSALGVDVLCFLERD